MIIYICGPMTGIKEFNRPAFNLEAALLEQGGDVVLNPAVLPSGLSQFQHMDICLAMLRSAEAIFPLKGWELSSGAQAEMALAHKLGLKIIEHGHYNFE